MIENFDWKYFNYHFVLLYVSTNLLFFGVGHIFIYFDMKHLPNSESSLRKYKIQDGTNEPLTVGKQPIKSSRKKIMLRSLIKVCLRSIQDTLESSSNESDHRGWCGWVDRIHDLCTIAYDSSRGDGQGALCMEVLL